MRIKIIRRVVAEIASKIRSCKLCISVKLIITRDKTIVVIDPTRAGPVVGTRPSHPVHLTVHVILMPTRSTFQMKTSCFTTIESLSYYLAAGPLASLWAALRKAWLGFKIAFSNGDTALMTHYASFITKVQTEMGIEVTDFDPVILRRTGHRGNLTKLFLQKTTTVQR